MAQEWKNGILRYDPEFPIEQLLPNPKNYRIHTGRQADATLGSIEQLGKIKPVFWNQRSGLLVDGHLRVELALQAGQASFPTIVLDLDPDEERLALADLDLLASSAGADGAAYRDLLIDLPVTNEALSSLLASYGASLGIEDEGEKPEKRKVDKVQQLLDNWGVNEEDVVLVWSAKRQKIEAVILVQDPRAGLRAEALPLANSALHEMLRSGDKG